MSSAAVRSLTKLAGFLVLAVFLLAIAPVLLPVLAIFFGTRELLAEAFWIPSGSMEPTVLTGDWLFVNKLRFGPHIPFTNHSLPGYASPKRGDVAVFVSPPQDMSIRITPDDITPTLVKRIVGVARFSEKGLREQLTAAGIECIAADLLDRAQIEALPKLPNVIFMAGFKFGASGHEAFTWAMNGYAPALVAEGFAGSRIVAYSTGCVYPYVNVLQGGATEATPMTPPPGAYANSCVAREQMFQYFSRTRGTPGRTIRLNYAIDMRYGVLFDIATRVHTGAALDLTMGHVNVIWQGDANEFVLRALNHCTVPSSPLNVSGPPTSVRWLADQFGRRFGKNPVFKGAEAPDAWLINVSESNRLLGEFADCLSQKVAGAATPEPQPIRGFSLLWALLTGRVRRLARR